MSEPMKFVPLTREEIAAYDSNRPWTPLVKLSALYHLDRVESAEREVAALKARVEEAERREAVWARAATAFRFRADHTKRCRRWITGESDSCNCPLKVAMDNLESVIAELAPAVEEAKDA